MDLLPEGVTEIELAPNYPALQINTPACSATLALHGAHLTHWQPKHTPHPVLYTSPTAIYKEGKAIRGGIPLCWPWFNAHPTAPDQHPSHGVARNRFWKLESATQINENLEVILTLPATPTIREHVPFDYDLRARFTLGHTLTLSLETTNLSPQPIPVGGALHTYFAISNTSNIHLTGLQNTPYLDTTTTPESDLTQPEEQLAISSEVDRIYYGTSNPVIITDPAWKREINVSKESSLTTVIWNPWTEKAAALADLPDEAYHDFVCIEACNARHDTRILLPNQTHTLATTISLS
ncbi:MAG: D-hexose-6-phosphate mutarotase [Verrucomicrobiota bacterium]